MATIVKVTTKAGARWKAVVRRRGWPTLSKTFRVKRDAEHWASRTEVEMEQGVFIDRATSAKMTFDKALDRYLSEVTPTKKSSTQLREQRRAKILRAYFAKYSLAAITPDLVAKYRDERLATTSKRVHQAIGKPSTMSSNSIRLELAMLSHLFVTAIREWRIGLASNPVSMVRKPTPGQGRNRRLLPDEEQKLRAHLAAYSNPMVAWIFDIALETGMRVSEIRGLRMSQVNVDRRVVRLTDTKNNEARTVPLTKHAATVFDAALGNPLRPDNCDLVFFGEPNKKGIRKPYDFQKVWNTIKTSLGYTDLHFHDLRHEAVSRLVEAGFSDQEVSAISGHKSMQMLKRYTHLRAEDLVDRLDSIGEPKSTRSKNKAAA